MPQNFSVASPDLSTLLSVQPLSGFAKNSCSQNDVLLNINLQKTKAKEKGKGRLSLSLILPWLEKILHCASLKCLEML